MSRRKYHMHFSEALKAETAEFRWNTLESKLLDVPLRVDFALEKASELQKHGRSDHFQGPQEPTPAWKGTTAWVTFSCTKCSWIQCLRALAQSILASLSLFPRSASN